jgi:hypothetical protein
MPSVLTAEQVERYRRDGIVFPLRAFDAKTTGDNAQWFAERADRIKGRINQKPHHC